MNYQGKEEILKEFQTEKAVHQHKNGIRLPLAIPSATRVLRQNTFNILKENYFQL